MSLAAQKVALLMTVLLCITGRAMAAETIVGMIAITGAEQSAGGEWDTGTLTLTVAGHSVSVAYGRFSTPEGIASAFGALLSNDCGSPVYAQATENLLKFYARSSGALISISMKSVSDKPLLFPNSSFQMIRVIDWSTPQIANLSLSHGPPQMGFVITGSGFTADARVTIGGVPAKIIGVPTSTQITVQVPENATSSGVVVTVNGIPSARMPFTVTTPFE